MKYHGIISSTGSIELSPEQMVMLSKFAEKKCVISIPKKTRSLSQNALYWCYLQIIEKETGNVADDLHHYFKRTLLPPRFIKIKGKKGVKELKIPASTTKLSKIEMGEYLDKISAMTNVPVPNPSDAGYFTG